MRIKPFSIALALFSVMFFSEAFAEVYFSGWTNAPDSIPNESFGAIEDDDYQLKPDNYFRPYTLQQNTKIPRKEKMIIIDPRRHTWKAYSASGKLIRGGMVTAGGKWCSDIGRPCRTKSGTFRIYSLGGSDCYSKKFPVGRGGAPMPYCMYFNGGQALHGSYQVVAGNVSHGCVRLRVSDARWIRYNFATIGTKVIVRPY